MEMHQISDIFQFVTCPYRWYQTRVLLLDFQNIYTIMGKISDEKTHFRNMRKNSETEYEVYDVSVGDGQELYGICDTVLFLKNSDGSYISGLSKNSKDKYKIAPMEYKQKQHLQHLQKASHLQCVAQARCLGSIFKCQISEYFIFYKQEHRRKKYEIHEADFQELQNTLDQMNQYLIEKRVPPRLFIEKSCPKCSMYEYCLPENVSSSTLSAYLSKEGE